MMVVLARLTFLAACIGLVATFIPDLQAGSPAVVMGVLINTLSYFTVQSNIIVAVCSFAFAFPSDSLWSNFLRHTQASTAATLYILCTGIIHLVLLAPIAEYEGWKKVHDIFSHYVVVVLMPTLWWFVREPKSLKMGSAFYWLAFPILYLIYWLIRGSIIQEYPYFFMDLTQYSAQQVAVNCVVLAFVFWLFGAGLVLLNRLPVKLFH